MSQNITASFGKIALARKSASVAAFRIEHPFERKSLFDGNSTSASWQASTKIDGGGGFRQLRLDLESGTVLAFQATATANGVRMADGTVFLRLRASAPVLSISLHLPTGPLSLLGEAHTVFVGCADVLTLEELTTLGYEINRGYISTFMQEEEIAELLSVNVLRAGTEPPPVFVRTATATGVVVSAVAQEPIRRIRVRR